MGAVGLWRCWCQSLNALDELFGAVDSLAGHLARDVRAGASEVLGNAFEIVGTAKEGADVIVNARIVPYQPVKFCLKAAMTFVDAASGFEDQSLGRVIPAR
jgi:hypothetical protein